MNEICDKLTSRGNTKIPWGFPRKIVLCKQQFISYSLYQYQYKGDGKNDRTGTACRSSKPDERKTCGRLSGSHRRLSWLRYVGDYFKCRKYITGFTGSAGTAVITSDMAGLWTDGRYFIQAAQQLEGTTVTLFKMGEPDGSYRPIFCRHCDEPECVISCMSGALTKNPEDGHVYYDREKCGSCFMCVMNCPYGGSEPDDATKSIVIKCDFCKDLAESQAV